MSMSYWGIIGFGVCIDDVYKFFNTEKINKQVRIFNPNIDFEEDVFDDDTFYGNPYTNIAEFLCEYDTKKILSWNDDGNGRNFFLYEPPYPWAVRPDEPKSLNEIKDYMIQILQKVCDASYEDLDQKLDYINTWGCG